VFDVLDRSQQRPGEIRPAETIVAGTDDFVIASSDPVRIPSQARVPPRYGKSLQHAGEIVVAEMDKRAFVRREVLYENLRIGSIYAALDIAPKCATNAGRRPAEATAIASTVARAAGPVTVRT
jgi:hypothetical protein